MINLAAYIYIVEFDDVDGTRFRKFGIGRIGTTVDRLETHIGLGARVIDVQKETLLTCVVAEQGIKINVGEVAYLPLIEMSQVGEPNAMR